MAEAEKIWPGGEYDYLKQDIQKELAGLTGVKVKKLTEEAWEYYDRKDFESSLEKCQAVLKLSPANASIQRLQKLIERDTTPDPKQEAQKLAREAYTLYESGSYKEALAKINEALEQDTENISNKAIKKLIERALKPTSPSAPPAVTSEGDSTLQAGAKKTIRIKGIEYTFRWCPSGTFEMGDDIFSAHEVTLSQGFWLLEHEVTQEMWESVMGENPSDFSSTGYCKDRISGSTAQYPVESVSWSDCQEFIIEIQNSAPPGLKFALPSEAEWEYACRAGTTGEYGGSGDFDEIGWYGHKKEYGDNLGNSNKRTHEVKTKKPNAWGLYDMHGNVFEWCNDWYGEDYYTQSPSTDPPGPDSGSSRVRRGGSWNFSAQYCRSAYRSGLVPEGRLDSLGFRLVLSSTSSPKPPEKTKPDPKQEAQKLVEEAWELYQSKDYKEALAKINEALEQDTENISNKAIKKLIETALAPKASPSLESSSTTVSPSEMGEGPSAGTKKTIRIKGIDYTFCWCPAGTFEMGSPESEEERFKNETQHTVTLSQGFWLLEHEVTLEMFRSFMESSSYKMGDGYEGKGGWGYNAEKDKYEQDPKYTWENPGFSQDDDHPVTNVDWAGAKAFCKWLSQESGEKIDLPSEAEWEYACRAGTTSPFNFGEVLNGKQANCDGNYPYGTYEKGQDLKKTTRVKSYSPNAWGLYDMHGNVWEWCNDWYDKDYYTNSPSTDPKGPDSGSDRVYRGGSWGNNARLCRSAFRFGLDPAYRFNSLGFRLALSSLH